MLLDKRKNYLSSSTHSIDEKYKYTNDMFEVHKYLFDYPDLIKNTPVKKIEINNEQVVFTVHNNRDILISCDRRDANSIPISCLNFMVYDEAEEMDMILKLLKPGDVVFDIGANVGWYTINILLKCKGTSVYSFEPIESSYQYLKKNLTLNNLNTDKAYNIGFSDENKKVKFYFDIKFSMASSMANLREEEDTVLVDCEVKKLDDFVSTMLSLERLDFIKCDVEGAELFVFKGAIETIKKYKPIIFSEMLRKWTAKFNYHPNQIIHFLKDLGYICFIPHNGQLKEFFEMDENTIETNFFFLHEDQHNNQLLEIP